MDARLVDEASEWLDQTWDALGAEPYYDRDEFALLRRMESDIRQYTPELQSAIRIALGRWLRGEDRAKIVFGLDLVERLDATEVLPDVEKLYGDTAAGRSPLRCDWLDLVKQARDHLRRARRSRG